MSAKFQLLSNSFLNAKTLNSQPSSWGWQPSRGWYPITPTQLLHPITSSVYPRSMTASALPYIIKRIWIELVASPATHYKVDCNWNGSRWEPCNVYLVERIALDVDDRMASFAEAHRLAVCRYVLYCISIFPSLQTNVYKYYTFMILSYPT